MWTPNFEGLYLQKYCEFFNSVKISITSRKKPIWWDQHANFVMYPPMDFIQILLKQHSKTLDRLSGTLFPLKLNNHLLLNLKRSTKIIFSQVISKHLELYCFVLLPSLTYDVFYLFNFYVFISHKLSANTLSFMYSLVHFPLK